SLEYLGMDRAELIGDYFVSVDSSRSQPSIDIYSLLQQSYNDNNSRTGRIRAEFVEPVSKKSVLEFSYEYDYTSIVNGREVWDVEALHRIDSLEIDYNYLFHRHRYGLVYQVEQSPRFK